MSSILAEYDQYDGLGLAQLVRSGEVSAEELLDTALERVAQINPSINAITTKMEAQARAQIARGIGDGPFAGVPFLIKDLLSAVEGVPMSTGSAFTKDYVPRYDSEIVLRWRRAGFVAFAKTNAPEFGLVPTTEPAAFGATRNPWNLEHTAGGSSGGSGAAVAAGIVPIASANDGGGSIRIPAACNGLVGLKPTRGRTPLGPESTDPWMGNVVDHVVSRSVRDCAAVLDATAGPDPGAPNSPPPPARPYLEEIGAPPGRLRIAFTRTPLIATTYAPQVVRALEETVALLESLGHELVEAKPAVDGAAFAAAFLKLISAETAADIEYFTRLQARKPRKGQLELATRGLQKVGYVLSAVDLSNAVRTLRFQGRIVGRFMADYDVFLTPTLALPPVKLGTLLPTASEARGLQTLIALPIGKLFVRSGQLDKTALKVYEFVDGTPIANVTGAPAISLPLAWNEGGLPLGMMFSARYGDEATLIRLAAQLEVAKPWFDRRPPLARRAREAAAASHAR
jgi:amidase